MNDLLYTSLIMAKKVHALLLCPVKKRKAKAIRQHKRFKNK